MLHLERMLLIRLNGRALLARFALLTLSFSCLVLPALANAKPPARGTRTTPDRTPLPARAPPPDSKPTLEHVEDSLAQAKSPSEARALRVQADTLRLANLSPAVMVLLQKGRDLQKANKVQNAENALSDALTLQVDQAILWRFRATVRAQGQDARGAIADLGVALRLDPKDPSSLRLLSKVEARYGDADAAQRALKRLYSLDPTAKIAPHQTDEQTSRALKLSF